MVTIQEAQASITSGRQALEQQRQAIESAYVPQQRTRAQLAGVTRQQQAMWKQAEQQRTLAKARAIKEYQQQVSRFEEGATETQQQIEKVRAAQREAAEWAQARELIKKNKAWAAYGSPIYDKVRALLSGTSGQPRITAPEEQIQEKKAWAPTSGVASIPVLADLYKMAGIKLTDEQISEMGLTREQLESGRTFDTSGMTAAEAMGQQAAARRALGKIAGYYGESETITPEVVVAGGPGTKEDLLRRQALGYTPPVMEKVGDRWIEVEPGRYEGTKLTRLQGVDIARAREPLKPESWVSKTVGAIGGALGTMFAPVVRKPGLTTYQKGLAMGAGAYEGGRGAVKGLMFMSPGERAVLEAARQVPKVVEVAPAALDMPGPPSTYDIATGVAPEVKTAVTIWGVSQTPFWIPSIVAAKTAKDVYEVGPTIAEPLVTPPTPTPPPEIISAIPKIAEPLIPSVTIPEKIPEMFAAIPAVAEPLIPRVTMPEKTPEMFAAIPGIVQPFIKPRMQKEALLTAAIGYKTGEGIAKAAPGIVEPYVIQRPPTLFLKGAEKVIEGAPAVAATFVPTPTTDIKINWVPTPEQAVVPTAAGLGIGAGALKTGFEFFVSKKPLEGVSPQRALIQFGTEFEKAKETELEVVKAKAKAYDFWEQFKTAETREEQAKYEKELGKLGVDVELIYDWGKPKDERLYYEMVTPRAMQLAREPKNIFGVERTQEMKTVPFFTRMLYKGVEEPITDISTKILYQVPKGDIAGLKRQDPLFQYPKPAKFIGGATAVGFQLGMLSTVPYAAPTMFLGGTAEAALKPKEFIRFAKEEPQEVIMAALYGAGKAYQGYRALTRLRPTTGYVQPKVLEQKHFAKTLTKAEKKAYGMGRESLITTKGRDVLGKLGIKKFKDPLYRATEFSKLTKKETAKLIKGLKKTGMTEKEAIKFLKYYEPTYKVGGVKMTAGPWKSKPWTGVSEASVSQRAVGARGLFEGTTTTQKLPAKVSSMKSMKFIKQEYKRTWRHFYEPSETILYRTRADIPWGLRGLGRPWVDPYQVYKVSQYTPKLGEVSRGFIIQKGKLKGEFAEIPGIQKGEIIFAQARRTTKKGLALIEFTPGEVTSKGVQKGVVFDPLTNIMSKTKGRFVTQEFRPDIASEWFRGYNMYFKKTPQGDVPWDKVVQQAQKFTIKGKTVAKFKSMEFIKSPADVAPSEMFESVTATTGRLFKPGVKTIEVTKGIRKPFDQYAVGREVPRPDEILKVTKVKSKSVSFWKSLEREMRGDKIAAAAEAKRIAKIQAANKRLFKDYAKLKVEGQTLKDVAPIGTIRTTTGTGPLSRGQQTQIMFTEEALKWSQAPAPATALDFQKTVLPSPIVLSDTIRTPSIPLFQGRDLITATLAIPKTLQAPVTPLEQVRILDLSLERVIPIQPQPQVPRIIQEQPQVLGVRQVLIQPPLTPQITPPTPVTPPTPPSRPTTRTTFDDFFKIKPIIPPLKVIKEPSKVRFPKPPKKPEVKGAFDVSVRRKGVFQVVSPVPLPKGQALWLGRKITKQEAAATFKITPTKKKPVSLFPSITEPALVKEYRKPKKKKTWEDELTFIQKKQYRIKTPGEIKAIALKGATARRQQWWK